MDCISSTSWRGPREVSSEERAGSCHGPAAFNAIRISGSTRSLQHSISRLQAIAADHPFAGAVLELAEGDVRQQLVQHLETQYESLREQRGVAYSRPWTDLEQCSRIDQQLLDLRNELEEARAAVERHQDSRTAGWAGILALVEEHLQLQRQVQLLQQEVQQLQGAPAAGVAGDSQQPPSGSEDMAAAAASSHSQQQEAATELQGAASTSGIQLQVEGSAMGAPNHHHHQQGYQAAAANLAAAQPLEQVAGSSQGMAAVVVVGDAADAAAAADPTSEVAGHAQRLPRRTTASVMEAALQQLKEALIDLQQQHPELRCTACVAALGEVEAAARVLKEWHEGGERKRKQSVQEYVLQIAGLRQAFLSEVAQPLRHVDASCKAAALLDHTWGVIEAVVAGCGYLLNARADQAAGRGQDRTQALIQQLQQAVGRLELLQRPLVQAAAAARDGGNPLAHERSASVRAIRAVVDKLQALGKAYLENLTKAERSMAKTKDAIDKWHQVMQGQQE